MKRAIRLAKQAQIKRRLYREYNRRLGRWAGDAWNTVTPEESLREKRRLLRNEGKPFRRCYECGGSYCRCEWCIDNKMCRVRREQERMHQEQEAWISGEDPAHPITELELSQPRKVGRRQKSASQIRRDNRHCLVCLAHLPENARLIVHCLDCHAMPSANIPCPRCSATRVWKNRNASACRNCGWHDIKLQFSA